MKRWSESTCAFCEAPIVLYRGDPGSNILTFEPEDRATLVVVGDFESRVWAAVKVVHACEEKKP